MRRLMGSSKIPLFIAIGLLGVGVAIGGVYLVKEKPTMFGLVDDKLESIVTPKPPIGDLSPVRDIKGTWKSSLSKKGLQVYGSFNAGPAVTKVYENGDVELVIDKVEGNTATGRIRYTDLCATAETKAPNIKTITTTQCNKDSGYLPATIRITGSALDFGTFNTNDVAITMQGSYVTDIMSGSMTATLPGFGMLKGEFRLSRVK